MMVLQALFWKGLFGSMSVTLREFGCMGGPARAEGERIDCVRLEEKDIMRAAV